MVDLFVYFFKRWIHKSRKPRESKISKGLVPHIRSRESAPHSCRFIHTGSQAALNAHFRCIPSILKAFPERNIADDTMRSCQMQKSQIWKIFEGKSEPGRTVPRWRSSLVMRNLFSKRWKENDSTKMRWQEFRSSTSATDEQLPSVLLHVPPAPHALVHVETCGIPQCETKQPMAVLFLFF